MSKQIINIRTDKFTKQEIQIIEESLKEWNYEWIVEIVYVGENKDENLDVSFIIEQENLGELLRVIFGCGHELAFNG